MAEQPERVATKAGSKETLTQFRQKLEKHSLGLANESSSIQDKEKPMVCYDESANAEVAEHAKLEEIGKARAEFLKKTEDDLVKVGQEEFDKIVPKKGDAPDADHDNDCK